MFSKLFKKKKVFGNRVVYIGNQILSDLCDDLPVKYPPNRIISSKYTAWNFIPKNLFEQFHRVANLYFLMVAIVQLCIDSPVSPYTSILPLAFVITVGAIKQGYEDWLRHKADREVNHREAYVVRNGRQSIIRCMDIQVGDVVRVEANDSIPCDLVLLSSADASGLCYVTTANLDGETNLKTFTSVMATQTFQTDESFVQLRAAVECEQPNSNFYQFVGRMKIFGDVFQPPDVHPLTTETVLLAGCSLKNTRFIYGCAIYTGRETKMFLNSKRKSHKYSRVERRMNVFLVIYLLLLLSYAAIWVGVTLSYYRERHLSYVPNHLADRFWRPSEHTSSKTNSVVQLFLGYMVLCNYVIPISMYVSIEIQKFTGSKFFEWDLKMYNAKTDEPAKAMTSDLNEELGQIEYLFTDKTGTLTENKMEFRMCSVGGAICEEIEGRLWQKCNGYNSCDLPPQLDDLLIALALCHTVRVDRRNSRACSNYIWQCHGSEMLPEYQSASPDEKALVEACLRFGFTFHGCENNKILLTIHSEDKQFILEHVFDFDPIRKRMSVIVRDLVRDLASVMECLLVLYTKGADVSMLERISNGSIEIIENHINEFSKLGLRTLVVARRYLSEDFFAEIDRRLRAARELISGREENLAPIYNEVENDLDLLGATAVEDKLQEGVPDTIQALRLAGIKVWILTGDKEETATSVGFASGLFNDTMNLLHLTKKVGLDDCSTALQHCMEITELHDEACGLIIDGASLMIMIEELREKLHFLCERCVTVLCCRMTPIQKAQVVKLMKSGKKDPTTAAIGDGANDVGMIQEAHIGLGIMGKEGRQAVQASDYSFSQFRYLKRALFVHGHYFYVRTATLVQYFFYKNVAMVACQLYYTFFTAFSAQVLYDAFFLTLYNSVFTSLSILIYGLFEQNVSSRNLLENPWCYRTLCRNERLSYWNFICWTTLGVWHSLVLFFGAYFALMKGNSPFRGGQGIGNYDFGAVIMASCVITVNIKLLIESYYLNGIFLASIAFSFSAFFVSSIFYSSVFLPFPGTKTLHGSMVTMLCSPFVWLLIMLQVVAALLPDLIGRSLRDTFGQLYRFKRRTRTRRTFCHPMYDPRETFVSCTRSSGTLSISQTNILEEQTSSH